MLRAVLVFLAMVATTCLVFAGLGILTWPLAVAVLIGSGLGSALAWISRRSSRPTAPRDAAQ